MGKIYAVSCKKTDDEGRGIVVFNGSTFSVPFLMDGEKGMISLVYGRNQTGARLEEVTKESPDRVAPPCPYYMQCGGCDMMHMNYSKQLAVKKQHVLNVLDKRIASDRPEVEDIVPSEHPLGYRNKIHNTYGKDNGKVVSGLYMGNTHKLMSLPEGCQIENAAAKEVLKTIRDFANGKHIRIYDEDRRTGVLRHVLIRVASNGDMMVVPVIGENIFPEKHALADTIVRKHPFVKTVVLNYNSAATTMVLGKKEEVLYGPGYISETLCGCEFRISPRSFFQVNKEQTEKLYGKAMEMAAIRPDERVVDAYCGTGTIGILAAKMEEKATVTGVELNADAVRDAKSNAERNQISNAEWICADAGEYLQGAAARKEQVDVLFMDPPRSGSTPQFLKAVRSIAPKRIVYISCNPDTLARDLDILGRSYRLTRVCPVDMFSQSHHVETVVLLSKLREAKHHVSVTLDMDEMDLTSAESKATYEEIKKYVAEHNDGMKVSSLNIAQVKVKYGIIERENYNKAKSEEARQPVCPKDKEEAIVEALKAFRMI